MAQIISGISETKVISSLDTYNHTTKAASMYSVTVTLSEIPTSGLSIVIKQNSSTIATSIAATPNQNSISLQTVINCALNDVIGIVITSTSAVEAGPNQFKGILNIHQGSI